MIKRGNSKSNNTKRDIENYEKNLSTQCENLRKCIDMQITSMLPEQDRTIKTYLWFNIAMIGAAFSIILKYYEAIFILPDLYQIFILISFILFLLCSIFSIFYCLLSIQKVIEVAYGSFKNKNIMSRIKKDEYARAAGLSKTLDCLHAAFDLNNINIQKKAAMIRTALNAIILAFVLFIVFSIFFFAVIHISIMK
jgi:hypothetical protein